MPTFYSLTNLAVRAFRLVSNGAHIKEKTKKIADITKTHEKETKKNEDHEKKEIRELNKQAAADQKKATADITKRKQEIDLKIIEAMKQSMQSDQYLHIAKKTLKQQLRNRMQSQKNPITYIKKRG